MPGGAATSRCRTRSPRRLVAVAAVGSALALGGSLLAAFLLSAHALPAEMRVRHALAGSLFGFSLAATVSNYPSVLIGYGAAPIIGYGLALALADHTPSG